MTPAPPEIPLVMRARLGELDGCWLAARCGCGRSCSIPLRLLAARYGAGQYLGAILGRLQCQQCAAKPVEASLKERGDSGASGGVKGSWSIPLLPPTGYASKL